jgi:uncharacterized membrane protein YdjX (TVP38/TMEM64 family)
MVFSFIGFSSPAHDGWLMAFVGAAAATLGRASLARMSHLILRQRVMSESARANIDKIRARIEHRGKLTFGVFLSYALTPLPSNYLFIAYGLTAMDLWRIAIPFFIGRVVSYRFWAFTASAVARHVSFESTEALSYLSVYFVASQILLLSLVYVFVRIDWSALLQEKKLKWLPRDRNPKAPASTPSKP